MNVKLKEMTFELFHELFRGFEYDPDMFMDSELYEKARCLTYDRDRVDAYYNKRMAADDCLSFAVMLDSIVIGEVVLKHIDRDKKQCELGIHLINDRYKNKGYGSEAERLAIEYAFDTLAMDRIYADSILKNKRSQHVLEKLGFTETGEENGFKYYVLEREK